MTELPGSVAERLQRMQVTDQALVLGRMIEARNPDSIIRPRDVLSLFSSLGLPAPPSISSTFRTLRQRGHLTPTQRPGEWRVTPIGRGESERGVSDVDISRLVAETDVRRSAVLGSYAHPLVPPTLAPPGLLIPIINFNERFPFDTNVFGMTRFPGPREDEVADPVDTTLCTIADSTAAHGLRFHLASDRSMVDDLWANTTAHMWASRYGVGIFEDRRGRGLNYNLVIEVGGMLMAGRRCLLLKDKSIAQMPTDFVGMIYASVDMDDQESVSSAVHKWVREDLELGSCAGCLSAA